ncbi:uncharacterized protein LOC143891940 [Tasmannia lanceolata]|uniref:uncharacterized protein LOC143891940 n=1 Tax=Tasmannia lanceolata TaxID=3420 RepID=UPI0040632131
MGPIQPRNHDFPQIMQGKENRRFNPKWFDEYPTWLEYSIAKDAAYCLCCYLFKSDSKEHVGSCDAFVVKGFSNWKKVERFGKHIGGPNSAHNQASSKCEALRNQEQHIEALVNKQTEQQQSDYRIRLHASVLNARFLLEQGLPFRGHDESCDSLNQGNFRQHLKFMTMINEDIKRVCVEKCPGNLKLVTSDIQKDIVSACAIETTNSIIKDLGDSLFSILVDEARDVSNKEQMAVVIRYVDKLGHVIERLLGITHVPNTTATSLKEEIEALLAKHKLSISRLRGQGYDGASNMQGEFNGLKALILKENEYAYYVHCFAHQLQLALVGVAKKNMNISDLFFLVTNVVNVVGGSCKRHDILQEIQLAKIKRQGLNQETTLKRAGDTRWSSHYRTLVSLEYMFSSILDVLDLIVKDMKLSSDQRHEAHNLLKSLQTFEFIFSLHLMISLLGITNELSQALQRKDQDIVNAMTLVRISKQRLQLMRDNGWNSLLDDISSFCAKHDIKVPNMVDTYVVPGRVRRHVDKRTVLHHFQVELFFQVIDLQLQELNSRFNEANTELLLCVACLNPSDSFYAFDKEKLIRLSKFYLKEFPEVQYSTKELDNQLETYILDMRSNTHFVNLKGIGDLAEKMVEKGKHALYPLVYKLITLVLILPVATATVERAFSAMKILKNRLRNRMSDQFMADCLIPYVEKDIFYNIDDETIMCRFQKMRPRRGSL